MVRGKKRRKGKGEVKKRRATTIKRAGKRRGIRNSPNSPNSTQFVRNTARRSVNCLIRDIFSPIRNGVAYMSVLG